TDKLPLRTMPTRLQPLPGGPRRSGIALATVLPRPTRACPPMCIPTVAEPAAALDALAVVRDYHQRSKHRFAAYARGPDTLDWDAQPAPFRHSDGAAQIALPRLSTLAPGSALHKALQRPFAALAEVQPPLPADLAS